MPDTLPDISIPSNEWVNVESATGITTGTALIIQNKGADGMLLAIQTAQPDAASTDGPQVYQAPYPNSVITVDSGENAVWLKSAGRAGSTGKANVQIGTATGGGGGVTVQSDWDQTDNTQDDFIRNKPTALSEFTNDLTFVETVTSTSSLITVDATDAQNPTLATTATQGIVTQDEGTQVDATATTLNFVGNLVAATDAGSNVTTVTVDTTPINDMFATPITVQNAGTELTDDVEQINFVGGGVTATNSAGNVTVTVPTIPSNASQLTNDDTFVESVTVGTGPITVNAADPKNPIISSTAITGIRVEDEGTTDVATATALNFTGNAVTVTDAGSGEATVNIDTSNFSSTFSAPITVQEEGTNVATAVDQINFVGPDITTTASGNDITVTVGAIPESTSDLTNDSLVASVVAVAPGISVDNTDPRNPRISSNAITGVRVEEEGVSTVAAATAINFVGSSVTVTDGGSNEATVTITTPTAGDVAISEEGTELTGAVESINFVGSATATTSGNAVTVTVPTIPTDVSELTNTSLLDSVVAGTGIQVDNTDAINPVISEDTRVVSRTQATTQTLDLNSGRTFVVTASANTTIAFSNIPSGSTTWKLVVNVSNSATVSLPTAQYPGGTVPTLEDGKNILVYTTEDGGTTLAAVHVGGAVFS